MKKNANKPPPGRRMTLSQTMMLKGGLINRLNEIKGLNGEEFKMKTPSP